MADSIQGPMVVLTGAGISAESGIPTFRGQGGLWRNCDRALSLPKLRETSSTQSWVVSGFIYPLFCIGYAR